MKKNGLHRLEAEEEGRDFASNAYTQSSVKIVILKNVMMVIDEYRYTGTYYTLLYTTQVTEANDRVWLAAEKVECARPRRRHKLSFRSASSAIYTHRCQNLLRVDSFFTIIRQEPGRYKKTSTCCLVQHAVISKLYF